jgi:geranylgeranyl diphosphate synthase type II
MILKKTCWYTCIRPIRIGAIIGTKGSINPDQFNRLGYFMGAAFQIQDDILNLVGEESAYGKEIGGDIIEGKRTLMLIHLMTHCSAKNLELIRTFLARPIRDRSLSEARTILGWMHSVGSIDYAKETSLYLAGAALKEFYTHFSHLRDSEDKAFLESLILYMINRSY